MRVKSDQRTRLQHMPKAIFAEMDEDDAFDFEDERYREHSLRRSRARLPWLRMAVLSALSVAGLVYLAQRTGRDELSGSPKAIPPAILVAPAPLWRPVTSAPPLYAIEKSSGPVVIEARQHSSGGRQDTLALGAFSDASHGRISFIHGFNEPARSFFVQLVRQAAEAGLSVTRNAQSRLLATKFGPVETASVTLAGTTERNCQAFRFADAEASFGFHGWLCGTDAQAVDESQLACFIDRISLAADDDPALRAVFARADRNRLDVCALGARTAAIGVRTRP
jgi:hypothetical protein